MKYLIAALKAVALALLIAFQPIMLTFFNRLKLGENVAIGITNFLIFTLSANLILLTLAFFYRSRKKRRMEKPDNVLVGMYNIFYLTVAGAVIMTILSFFGIDPKTLFTSLSIVAAAIAIVSKEYLTEIISGIIISFSKEINIDDYIKINEQKGKITDIHLTKVALLNEDDDIIFIPNHQVFSSQIVNYTKKEIRKVSIDFDMDMKFLDSIEDMEQDLTHTLVDFQQHIEPDSYNIRIVEIRKDSLSLKFQYILHRIDRELEREIRKKTVRRLVNYINSSHEEPQKEEG